jgi:hypothetical protein
MTIQRKEERAEQRGAGGQKSATRVPGAAMDNPGSA